MCVCGEGGDTTQKGAVQSGGTFIGVSVSSWYMASDCCENHLWKALIDATEKGSITWGDDEEEAEEG